MINACKMCQYYKTKKNEEPCSNCGDGKKWEPIWDMEIKRPEMLEKPVPAYESDTSEYPDILLVRSRAEHAWMHSGKWEPEELRRPEMLEKPVPVYESDTSEYPDIIRVSFRDGHTEIYERRLQQPAPIIMKCIETIREWNIGYQYQPKRRRRAKR